jgi:NADPH-dependent curcumin reductase CurA
VNERTAINRKIVYARRPVGEADLACFDLVVAPIDEIGAQQILVRNYFASVDPYIRIRMEEKDSYAPVMKIGDIVVGRTIAKVIESRHPDFHPGDWVVGRLGWQDYSVAPAAELQKINPATAPLTAYLGCLGSTGITAWIGLVEIGRPKNGETVLVSAASGAVGSVVGQLARRRGCRVVGIAGGATKCKVVVDEFGFDACVDYKAGAFAEDLRAAVRPGVDIYFDNVGGVILDTVLPLLKHGARIPLCGMVSQYNAIESYGVRNLREIFNHRVTMRGFVISDHRDLWPAATGELEQAYAAGELKSRETIAEGLENAPQAFIGMLKGGNIGKQIVRIHSD